MTLLQHQKCHAAASSSATRVVTVGIASGRGERRGSERGKGEEGRKWVIAVAGITVGVGITHRMYIMHWNSCSHERHWFCYTYLICYAKVSMGIDEKLCYRDMSMKTRTMECSFPILLCRGHKEFQTQTLWLEIKSPSIQLGNRLTLSFPTTNLDSGEDLTPRQLADQDAVTLLQHQKCYAAASSIACH